MSLGHARRRSTSSAGKSLRSLLAPETVFDSEPDFQPCAATASIFLFAQGCTIYCLHHDTLTVERRFEKHRQPVNLLSVDNVSERGAGRLVLSYDVERTAIVWDLFTGDEITRFASFKSLKVAAWMKNGNIAFGDSEGTVMLFEPATSEHKAKTTINTPVTAIAPAADCQTFVIGYENGSVLIATLLPTFTILHTLSTPCKPSAIVGLAWHASSSKQKSDMLAVQCADGDLRVWSVAKPVGSDVPKTIRVLERGDRVQSGVNWISWSKNGRIVQYSQGEAWSWDVRTKHVAYEPVPTVEGVRGIANFGPGAILFTLGPNNTVQQYDLNPPALVKTMPLDPDKRPPSSQSNPRSTSHTTTSTRSGRSGRSTGLASTPRAGGHIPGAAPPVPIYRAIDPPRNPSALTSIPGATEHLSAAEAARQLRNGTASPMSSASRTESISSRGSGYPAHRAPSVSAASGTTFSTLSPSMLGRENTGSPFWQRTGSVTSSGRRSHGSRLRSDIPGGPDGNVIDLFPHTRERLADMPASMQNAPALDQNTATSEQLRRQMLEIVFGWHGDIEPMLRDELQRHPVGSMSAMLLSKWLGDVDADLMSSMPSDAVSSHDWMMLALSAMSGNGVAGQQMARSFATRLASQGDIHTSATILLGIKDHDEAVEIYVSRNFYMEAILLTCLLFPSEWQRQAFLVRRWGEYVVENSQQHLAMRCFTCTGTDNPMAWATPTQAPFSSAGSVSAPQTLSPPISPPLHDRPPRLTAKNASLKLITTFGPSDKAGTFNFPGLQRVEDRTPTNVAGVTPIAESAGGNTPSTVIRPSQRVRTPSGQTRGRLSSIGETPVDVNPPLFPITRPQPLPTPDNSGSDAEKERAATMEKNDGLQIIEDAPLTLSSARYDPSEASQGKNQTPQTAIPGPGEQRHSAASNSELNAIQHAQERPMARNGSRDRKPSGLHITAPSLSQLNLNAIATGSSGRTPHSAHRRSNDATSLRSGGSHPIEPSRYDALSPPTTGQSWGTSSSVKSPSVSGRSVDAFISSLGEASYYAKQQKAQEKAHRQRSRDSNLENKSRSKARHRDHSESRGRADQRYIRPAKRSPSSPVPMSPDDLQKYRDTQTETTDSMASRGSSPEQGPRPRSHHRRKPQSKNRSVSKYSEQSQRTTVRHTSPDGGRDEARSTRSRGGSRRHSPNGLISPVDGRGRSKSRSGKVAGRSPSSPLPFSSQAALYRDEDDEREVDALRLVDANRDRVRSRQRSSSRKRPERSSSRPVEPRIGLDDVHYPPVNGFKTKESPRSSDPDQGGSDGTQPKLLRNRSHRSLKKEAAARELEARRESLNMRTAGPTSVLRPHLGSRTQSDLTVSNRELQGNYFASESFNGVSDGMASPPKLSPPVGTPPALSPPALSPPTRTGSAGNSPIGLPPTPRAMRRPTYPSKDEVVPVIPDIPDQFYATGQPMVEPNRCMSAPMPEPDMTIPGDIPIHPAFQRHLPRSAKKPNFHPLNEIGKHRRAGSIDLATTPAFLGSIGETLEGIDESAVIDVPVLGDRTGMVPELQHLAGPPPPPPPPPHFPHDPTHNSLSSGSGVGTINIVMDEPDDAAHPGHQRRGSKDKLVISPPLPHGTSPQKAGNNNNSSNNMAPVHGQTNGTNGVNDPNGHKRGRSIDQIGTKIGRVADRMRSASRGRNAANGARAREHSRDALGRSPPQTNTSSPYETKIAVGFF